MNLSGLLPRTLVARVFLLYSASMLFFVGLGFGFFVSHTASSLMQDADDEGQAIMAMLSPAISESAVIGDYDTIKRALERVAEHPVFDSGVFIDMKSGRVEAHRRVGVGLHAPAWLQHRIDERLADISTPIKAGGKDYGVLRLSFWTDRVGSELWRQALLALGLAVLSLLGGVGLVWFPLKHWLGNLGRIQAFGQELQQAGGQLSHVIDEAAPLEFRQTFEVLNRAAASLQVERAQAAVTLGAIADGVATVNRDGLVVLANPVLCGMLGHSSASLLGQRLQDLLPDLLPEGLQNKAWSGRRIRVGDQAHTQRVLEASLAVVSAEGDAAAGWVLALRDVTEQQMLEDRLRAELSARASAMAAMRDLLESARTEAQDLTLRDRPETENDIERLSQLVSEMVQHLRRQAGQLNAIFSLSPDGFVSFDEHRRVHFVSPAFSRLTGISAAQARDLPEGALQALMQERQTDKRGRLLDFDSLRQGRVNVELSSPSSRMLELALHQGQDSGITQVLHVRDVTHQFEVDRMKSEFLATAAHELRTPMTSIYGFTELLMLRDVGPERLREGLNRIYRQAGAMMNILNELLDLARIESRRGSDFEFADVELCRLVEETVQDFRPEGEREPPILELGAVPCWVHVDDAKLRQALRNLLSNAYKYSPQGGPVWVRVVQEPNDQLVVEVQDQGMGMTPEELAHMTERFYRADKSGAIPGSGLGMSIVKEIIELMGGRLHMQSTVGVGTTVGLGLNAVPAPQLEMVAAIE